MMMMAAVAWNLTHVAGSHNTRPIDVWSITSGGVGGGGLGTDLGKGNSGSRINVVSGPSTPGTGVTVAARRFYIHGSHIHVYIELISHRM